ncbi:MAG: hypothetical protein MSC30_05815 [Gaiellaceae bacterium MAG52_C11]|nr:hypothetical protein [Candidatus Gaiellasilicea maunaloa]
MRPIAGSDRVASSARALDRLRRDLRPTLSALDRAAADLDALDELGDDLPALQYALHTAAEQALVPRLGTDDGAYDELEYALLAAREETADVAEMLVEAGPAAAAPLLWEWRVALFGVRLALQRLEQAGVDEEPPPQPEARLRPLVLLGVGVALVLGGALSGTWPLWILGLALVAASAGLSRRP